MSDNSTQGQGDTGSGFLTGVEPAAPRNAADWQQGNAAQQVTQQPAQVVQERPAPTGRLFTEEEMAHARQQEKEKLYGRIEDMDKELKEVRKERQEREKLRKEQEAAAAEDQRRKEEEQMELRELINKRDKEYQEKLDAIERQRELDRATYERERSLMELESYKVQRIEQHAQEIAPELRDLVRGNTVEEVDASIADLINRTNAIFGNINAVTSQQQQPMPRGASPTSPPVGPMEQQQNYQQLTPDDIRSMDIETYKKYRDSLLASASRQYRGR